MDHHDEPDRMDPETRETLIKRVKVLTYAWLGMHIWMILVGAMTMSFYQSRFRSGTGWWVQ